ncbi:MAG TPA: aminopeptidase [Bacteroidetes bacterium]|nr:aminopeptidase [Bacteroidota bacterium]
MTKVVHLKALVLLALLVLPQIVLSQSGPAITAAEIQKHVKYLASDQLEGRKTGTKGGEAAARYIANEFKSYGLKPVGDQGTYFQKFEFVSGIELGDVNTLTLALPGKTTNLELNKDFRPLGFSTSEAYEGSVVFVGYGISDTAKKLDDYAGVDVSGMAVLVLRNAPPSEMGRDFSQYASLRYKASKAKEKGARALIVVTGPEDSDSDDLIRLTYDNSSGNAGLPALNVTRKTADQLLASAGVTVKDLQKKLNESKQSNSFLLKEVTVGAKISLKEVRQTTMNVVGLLEGEDESLKNQIMVFGAHYDHLGMGGEGSGSLRPDTSAVHHGADDNASGTAGVLELAQAFASNKNLLKRSMLFIAFTGEELGVLGSAYYVNHPIFPLEGTVAMLNMDMIGRMNNKTLIVYGIGTSPGFETLATKYNKDSTFVLKLNKDGYGPSDHASFYAKRVPVFNFFTDIHSDYHRPSDTYDRLNYPGEEKILHYIESIAIELNATADKPQYVAVEMPRQPAGGRSTRVTMGTIPDFGEQVQGFKISGVREGGPAAKAGLLGGDIIIKFGKIEIKNLYDFNYALGERKPGDEVDVVFKRGNETKTAKVTLQRRN